MAQLTLVCGLAAGRMARRHVLKLILVSSLVIVNTPTVMFVDMAMPMHVDRLIVDFSNLADIRLAQACTVLGRNTISGVLHLRRPSLPTKFLPVKVS